MPPPPDRAVPFIDLVSGYNRIRSELMAVVEDVADSQRFILGPAVSRLEGQLEKRLGVRHAFGVSSGTDALLMALMAMELSPGDEVITTPFSFVSTAEVILRVGAKPVFVDIDPSSFLIRPESVLARISKKTKAILPVHLYGRLCDMEGFAEISQKHGVAIIEDCAQSMGANGTKAAGAYGLFGAFSFFPTKNLGGWGDGGLVVTSDSNMADRLRQIRDHGAAKRDCYERLGGNFRLDTLQAALLEVKLKHLPDWISARRNAAKRYDALFRETKLVSHGGQLERGTPIVLPEWGDGEQHAFNLYVIQVEEREALRAHLDAEKVGSAVYYSAPIHLQRCFAFLDHREGDFPVTENATRTVLALPMYPEIEKEQQIRVVSTIEDFYRNRGQ
jgi:dTDP-4-amino-4,6-dideoxygalactose transaminase